MDNQLSSFELQMKKLQEQYVAQLPDKITAIQQDWKTIKEAASSPLMNQLHRNVHSLIGTSGTFGLMDISKRARELEIALKPYTLQEFDTLFPPNTQQEIDQKLESLIDAVVQAHN